MKQLDAIVVGGGPAGSTCARFLRRAGARVAVVDAAVFPRVKLCAGWLSVPVWEALEIAASEYPRGLWEWNRCHVRFGGRDHTVRVRGYFIRRCEFDHYLLERAGVEVMAGHRVKTIERDGDGAWIVDGQLRAPYLIGAGGTSCPVARAVFPGKLEPPVGVQELEYRAGAEAVAATRLGADGEPELVLHDDLRGYAWNVPKSDWLNVGCGTLRPQEVRGAWRDARAFFQGAGHLPPEAAAALDNARGHSYYLFHGARLPGAYRDGAFAVGDALGLAHPLTAEGILPAIVSGRLAAEAIADGTPADYPARLREHPVLRDYAVLRRLRDLKRPAASGRARMPGALAAPARRAVAFGFAWLFAGKPLPGARLLDKGLSVLGGR